MCVWNQKHPSHFLQGKGSAPDSIAHCGHSWPPRGLAISMPQTSSPVFPCAPTGFQGVERQSAPCCRCKSSPCCCFVVFSTSSGLEHDPRKNGGFSCFGFDCLLWGIGRWIQTLFWGRDWREHQSLPSVFAIHHVTVDAWQNFYLVM